MDLTEAKDIRRRGKNTQSYTKKIFTTQIITMVAGALSAGSRGRRSKCSQEELPHVQGQGQQPRVSGCNGAETAERSYPMSKARDGGREELPGVQGQGRHPRPGVGARRSNPTSKERWKSHSTLNVRKGGGGEISLLQGKERGCTSLEQP